MKTTSFQSIRELSYLVGLLSLLTVTLLVVGCTSSPPKTSNSGKPVDSSSTLSAIIPVRNDFVGSAACTECHAKEAKEHAQSGHATTLRPLSRKNLGDMAPPDGNIPNTDYAVASQGDVMGLATQGHPEAGIYPMQLVFGSGETGLTFVAVESPTRLAEMRMSYFPARRKWYTTPGQEKDKNRAMGRMHEGDFPARCVLCHAVTLPKNSIIPEQKFMGVGCESCHGAGSAHINAVRTGNMGNLQMEPLKTASGRRINEICGACHMTEKLVNEMNMPKDSTGRFQPYAIAISKCFKQGGEKMTCSTCHNPHSSISRDTKRYESLCIQCHTPNAKPTPTIAPAKTCPVNATSGCIQCHMPQQKIFKGTDVPITMPDHYIRIHKEKGG